MLLCRTLRGHAVWMPHSSCSLDLLCRSTTRLPPAPPPLPSFPLIHPFYSYESEAHSEMASKHQQFKSTKISPAGCACVCCVSIRAYAKPPNITLGHPDKLLEKSWIFPGISSALPSSSSAPLKAADLGLSPATPALTDVHKSAAVLLPFPPTPF